MAKVTLAGLDGKIQEEILPLLRDHDKILVRGNGEPSLQEKLRNIEAYIKEDKANRNFYFRLFVTVAVTNFATLAAAALVWFMKIYPLLQNIENLQKASF